MFCTKLRAQKLISAPSPGCLPLGFLEGLRKAFVFCLFPCPHLSNVLPATSRGKRKSSLRIKVYQSGTLTESMKRTNSLYIYKMDIKHNIKQTIVRLTNTLYPSLPMNWNGSLGNLKNWFDFNQFMVDLVRLSQNVNTKGY